MAKVTAISSLGWSHYTLYEALPRMAARGFARAEIASFGGYCFHFNSNSPDPEQLKTMLREFGLAPVCLNYFSGPRRAWIKNDVEQFVHDWTRKLPDVVAAGIPMMVMSLGLRNNRSDQESQLGGAVKAYDRVAALAKRFGIRMLLEVPHLYGITPRPEQTLWVFDCLSSDNIGALVDSSHWGIIQYNIEEFFSRLGDRLWHIHLRDSAGLDTGDRKQNLELTPGDGVVDFRRLARALDEVGYEGDVTTEFEYRDMPLETIESEYDRGLAHLKQCGWELPPTVRTG